MTASEWLASTDPAAMLEFLRPSFAGPYLDPARQRNAGRKLGLFACACCRLVWDLLTDELSRRAVEVAERHAERYLDGPAAEKELVAARTAAWTVAASLAASHPASHAVASAARTAAWTVAWGAAWADAAWDAAWNAACAAAWNAACAAAWRAVGPSTRDTAWLVGPFTRDTAWAAALCSARTAQTFLLRDLLGNPWRPPLSHKELARHGVFDWNGNTVPRLARAACDERDASGLVESVRLAVLADALEEAGCHSEDLLRHLRDDERPHVRGCWALDLILGME